jgi:ABC-type microcin C transport system duplicated ATPase subunit YejF
MEEGRIVEQGTIEAVFNNPQSEAARELIHG